MQQDRFLLFVFIEETFETPLSILSLLAHCYQPSKPRKAPANNRVSIAVRNSLCCGTDPKFQCLSVYYSLDSITCQMFFNICFPNFNRMIVLICLFSGLANYSTQTLSTFMLPIHTRLSVVNT